VCLGPDHPRLADVIKRLQRSSGARRCPHCEIKVAVGRYRPRGRMFWPFWTICPQLQTRPLQQACSGLCASPRPTLRKTQASNAASCVSASRTRAGRSRRNCGGVPISHARPPCWNAAHDPRWIFEQDRGHNNKGRKRMSKAQLATLIALCIGVSETYRQTSPWQRAKVDRPQVLTGQRRHKNLDRCLCACTRNRQGAEYQKARTGETPHQMTAIIDLGDTFADDRRGRRYIRRLIGRLGDNFVIRVIVFAEALFAGFDWCRLCHRFGNWSPCHYVRTHPAKAIQMPVV